MYAERVSLKVMDDVALVANARGIVKRAKGGGYGSLLWDMSINEIIAEATRLRKSLGLKEDT